MTEPAQLRWLRLFPGRTRFDSTTVPSATTNRVSEVRENPSGSNYQLAIYVYDDLGRRTGLARGNGTSTAYVYDPVSRLDTLTHNFAGTAHDVSFGLSYNPASQIASTIRTNDTYAWAGHYAINRNYTANGRNQYTAVGAITPTYDNRGNLTSAGGTSYAYTSENRLANAGSIYLPYDATGRLWEIYHSSTGTVARLDYVGGQLITELDAAGNVLRRYVPGPGIDEPLVWYEGSGTSDRRWFHADERGSIIARSDGAAAAAGINAYDESGIPASGNSGRFQYTGQPWIAELGKYYYRARFYSPTLGRFLQTDPIGYGDGMNLYAYVRNDPVNSTDPSGLCGEPICVTGVRFQLQNVAALLSAGSGAGFGGWADSGGASGGNGPAAEQCVGGTEGGQCTVVDPPPQRCPDVPSPGISRAELNRRVNATAERREVRNRDAFSLPGIDDRLELFLENIPGSTNDVKASVRGAEESGNFLFGAEAAAAGLSLSETLQWARFAQDATNYANGRPVTGRDNPGDANAITRGYTYYRRGCSRQ